MAKPRTSSHPSNAPTHVALLRGINVGGNHLLPMTELSKLFMGAGCTDVTTYIQSGNVVFSAPDVLASRLPKLISARVGELFGFQPAIMVRTAAHFMRVAASNPFLDTKADPKTLFVAFLEPTPDAAKIARIDPQRSPHDRFSVQGSEVYFQYTKGLLESKLTSAYIDAVLATSSTFRNWRTVTKLAEMLRPAPSSPATARQKARP